MTGRGFTPHEEVLLTLNASITDPIMKVLEQALATTKTLATTTVKATATIREGGIDMSTRDVIAHKQCAEVVEKECENDHAIAYNACLRARLPGPRARLYALRHLIEHGEFHPGCRAVVKRALLDAGLVDRDGAPTALGLRTLAVADAAKGRPPANRPGRPPGHVPRNKGIASISLRQSPRTASSVLRKLFEIMDRDGRSAAEIAARVGVTSVSLSRWRAGRVTPGVLDVEALAAVLGVVLTVQNEK